MEDVVAVFIPIVAIVMGIGVAMLALYFRHRQRDMIARERLAAIEKGIDPPPVPEGFLEEKPTQHRSGTYLLKGLIWLFVGVGILVASRWAEPELRQACAFGLIPAGVGIAYLIYYAVERKKLDAETEKLGPERTPLH